MDNGQFQPNLPFLSTIELRQIHYFLTVIEADHNMSRAAERLQIEQSPLSQRIRALEKRLRVQLFDRRRRPLQLTTAGIVFAREVRLALDQLDRAIAQAQRAERGEIGHLSLGIASSIANSILPELVQQFCQTYPKVELELRELTAEKQGKALCDRQLDLGLEVFPDSILHHPQLRHQPLQQESLVAVLHHQHPYAQQPAISLLALAEERLILPSVAAFPFYQTFLDSCHAAGFQPRQLEQTTATWMLTLLSLVAADMGIAILPSNVMNLQRRGVVYRAIEGLEMQRQISMVWHLDNDSVVLANFQQIAREVLSSLQFTQLPGSDIAMGV